MKMRRFLSIALAVCMLLTLAPVMPARAEESEELAFERLDSSEVNVDLAQEMTDAEALVLEREIDENEMVDVIIIMEGESVVESDSTAVLNAQTRLQMEKLEQGQAGVLAAIEEDVLDGEELEVNYSYTWLLNGVSATVPYGTIGEIKAIAGVEKVLLQPVYEVCATGTSTAEPNTVSDGVMVGREAAWANGYTGEGMKIAIIDTGLDTDHQNFTALSEDKLTEDSATPETVAAVLGDLNASDRWSGLTAGDVYYSTKVAYGFNYCDDNLDITHDNDSMGDHGTHVAGIAAANKVDGSDVVGVAPDAQLYILKVFGVNGGAKAEDILAALEDALMLGADVVNMSLGTAAGFTSSTDEINAIYARVAETNTVLSVSAGNNYTAGYTNNWGTDANLTENPDNAVIGEPAAYDNVLSVASVENWKIQRNYIQVSDGYQMGFVETSSSYSLPSVLSLDGEYQLVAVPNYGAAEDFEGLELTGKIALVSRGVESFVDKCTNAANAGAVACIVYNNTSDEFGMDLTGCTAGIPCVSITMAAGEYLVAALEENAELTVSFPEELASIPSETAYQMSDFSSWGVSPDLSLEPDITAPGGNIYSTINDGEYGLMSGTSMAAPNLAGITALVMQYAKENLETEDLRVLVQDLLMSTAVPLTNEDGLYYSPRSQGSGLANAYNAIVTGAYLTVDGCDVPKAELGEDADKTGAYGFSFNVHNFGDTAAYYDLATSVQTEGVLDYDGIYFMSGTPEALSGSAAESSANLVLTHDVDDDADTDSHDAYILYQAAIGNTEGWESEAFRYDVDGDDAVATADVQAYLDALVGNDSDADLADTVLKVAAGETAEVSVAVTLADADKDYFGTYYPNGGYVEGFTVLTARNEGGVDLSLPYLAFYGSWDDAPMLDNGEYWDLYNATGDEVIGSQFYHALFTNFYGYESYAYPGMNVYIDEDLDPAHISLSPNNDGYFDTIDDMYTSLLRNAETLTYRYTNMETGEVYYEQTAQKVSKSVYSSSYGQIIPNVYSWYEGEIDFWNWKNADGSDLENNTKLLLEVEAVGAYEGATADTWSVPITVDLEAPQLLSVKKLQDVETGEMSTLELTFRDNLSVSVAALMNSNGTAIYAMTGVEDVEPDENGYQTYTVSFDVTGVTGKVMVILGDYAMNEAYFGLNIAGEGTAYGELVAYQYNLSSDSSGWVSFDTGVSCDEVQITMDTMNFVCAEYVNGYVFAQAEDGKLYGVKYEDMLADTYDVEFTYITTLENVYQDLAYSYVEGKLFGLYTSEYDGYPTTEIYSINLNGDYFDEDMWTNVYAYQEDWFASRGGVYGLTLAVDDAGTLYVLGCNYDWDLEAVGETAYLWAAERIVYTDRWGSSVEYIFQNMGSTELTMDYLQSMTWDHNSETLYWARFDAEGWNTECELYTIDPETAAAVRVGTLTGETCALFAPLGEEAAAKEEHSSLPVMDSSVIGTPVLRDDAITLNVGGTKTLGFSMDPWYTAHKSVVWSSSDESVVTVDASGTITAVDSGSAVITVANAEDETKFDTVSVEVTALDLKLEGIISAQTAGVGSTSGVSTYAFEMVDGVAAFGTINAITAPDDLNYGLSLATSELGRGSIWACEYGNTGMIYEIDPETGVVKDVLQPVDGDMLFGLSYSESKDTFAGIMDMYLYVDLELTHEEEEKILGSYDEENHEFTYHKVNLLPYLIESNDGFVTGETGQGASSEVVFCGVTTLEDSYLYQDTYKDYLGNWSYSGSVNYIADQTLVLLDNVGRLWYIDEICGMTKQSDEWGNVVYESENGSYIAFYGEVRNGMFEMEVEDEEGNVTYNVFNIRKIDETPLTDMFREGTMPRITYHFSDIELAGYSAEGAPMFAMSLYDYWNNGTTNELYLYVPGVGTGEWVMDYETWISYEVMTPSRFYSLGNTGANNIIATIHSAVVTGGVDPEETEDNAGAAAVNKLAVGTYSVS